MKKWIKGIACVLMAVLLMTAAGGLSEADAASDCITVTSAITGQQLYSGNDLQEAFDAAERGSVVTIGRTYTLTQDAVLRVEVMIDGQNYLRFGTYKIKMSGNGAIYVTERFKRSSYVEALYDYSEVDWVEESGGYIYYLVTTAPSLEGYQPTIKKGGNLLGAYLDLELNTIFLDAVGTGLSTEDLTKAVSMRADFAEEVQFAYIGDADGYAANGMTLIAKAKNHDYNGSVNKSYQVVLLGDVNGNGRIDAGDASLISFHVGGSRELTGAALLAADANRDGVVNAADAAFICRKYVRPNQYATPLA